MLQLCVVHSVRATICYAGRQRIEILSTASGYQKTLPKKSILLTKHQLNSHRRLQSHKSLA